jgi:chromosome segregation protein
MLQLIPVESSGIQNSFIFLEETMYLKSVELHGFKSFTDKTILNFRPGISAIVGPNGSGKSNISDAVRWVLGEQSAKSLRGNKMEDVIFAGTKNRKPLGMAEVSIICDNSDGFLPLEYNEVRVTRRTYRSGESEYLINNVSCRLKDIHNLFNDTGIGTDGFSIISQGEVEEILNCRAEERRSLIEETAGIVKYRNRKREADRKLAETQQNLERIGDIIFELSNRVEPLKEQAEQARIYRVLKNESDELEISLFAVSLEELKAKIAESTEILDREKLKLISFESGQAKLEAEIEELKLSLSRRDEEIASLQQDLYQIGSEIERRESDRKLFSAQKDAALAQISRLEGEITELAEKIKGKKECIGREEEKLSVLTESICSSRNKITAQEDIQKERTEKIVALEAEIESCKSEAFGLVQEIANLRNEAAHWEQSIQSLAVLVQKLHNQEGEFCRFISDLKVKQLSMEEEIFQGNQEVDNLDRKISQLDEIIVALEKQEKALREKEAIDREDYQAVKSRLDVLKEMQEGYEGYYPGVKAILLGKRRGNAGCGDVVGVIAELIKVPEELGIAVETALGGALQNIVTKTDQGAKAAIEYLKKTKSGRATFLPLNVLRPAPTKSFPGLSQDISGIIGWGSELVSCQEQVRPAIDFLLRQVLIVRDMDAALKAARAAKYQVRIVTLDGDIINPGGALTGGSQQKKNGRLLARIEEIEKLTKHEREAEVHYQETRRLLQLNGKELDKEKNQREQVAKDLQELKVRLAAGGQELTQVREALQTAQDNLQLVQEEILENQREIAVSQGEKEKLAEKLAFTEEQNHLLSHQISRLQQQLEAEKESQNQRQDGLTDIKVCLAGLIQEETSVRENRQRLKEELGILQLDLEKREREKSTFQQEAREKSEALEKGYQELLILQKEESDLGNTLNQRKHARMAELSIQEEKEKEARETGKRAAILRQEVHQLEIKQSRLEMEWEKNLERLKEKFQLDFNQARLLKKEIPSKRAATQRIGDIARDLEALGPVNINAIEEYEQVNERYQFLLNQEKDLREARESLFKVIEEMERIMIRKFRETFTEVSREFNHTFQHLFGGGVAELRLTDPDNLLETGIDIIVQPPGKKVQHHNLLSGGEKALTGIALLFAVLTVRPSPFCIFDEIEAALDEANVDRFAAYMKQFADGTQFIVVTHRQGTMEAADVLYGITMEENGVSKTVSVKLAEVEKVG